MPFKLTVSMKALITCTVISLTLAFAPATQAADRTWTGAANNDWFNNANWLPSGYPQTGHSVDITNGSVLLTSDTAVLTSLSIANATLIFSNWTTRLLATNVTMQNGGKFTLPAAFTTSQMSNRVWVVCTNLTMEAGGSMDVDGKGYAQQYGPGLGSGSSGSGYGGKGANGGSGGGGSTYGSTNTPTDPGSGSIRVDGGTGGGAVRIEASGNVTVNGTITANGVTATYGGGSGGGIYVT